MSTISKERLEQLASGNAWVCVQDDEAAELARIALASLEVGPVAITDYMAYAFHNALSDSSLGADEVEEIKDGLRAAFANVTAPPAPVSVPDFSALDRLAGEMLTHAMNCERRVAVAYTHCAHRLAEEVRDLRAAMLDQEKSNG